jgi:hypothetical protein
LIKFIILDEGTEEMGSSIMELPIFKKEQLTSLGELP